jgi:hypothetical protein
MLKKRTALGAGSLAAGLLVGCAAISFASVKDSGDSARPLSAADCASGLISVGDVSYAAQLDTAAAGESADAVLDRWSAARGLNTSRGPLLAVDQHERAADFRGPDGKLKARVVLEPAGAGWRISQIQECG